MKKSRIAIVGPGLIGMRHLQLVAERSDSCVAAIVAPEKAKHDQTAAEYRVRRYSDMKTMLANEEIDGVIVASPNVRHVEQAMACVEARIPVLVEKPISDNYKSGAALVAAALNAGVPLMVGHHRAHSPIMKLAREIIRSGDLGKIVALTGSALFYKPDEYFAAAPWRRELGGGPILINLIHEVGNLRALCGEFASIQAISTSSTRGFAVEDTACLNIEFKNGALGVFILSDTAASARSWEQTSQENPSYPSYGDEDCYIISGTQGSLAVPTMRLKKYAGVSDRSWWKPFVTRDFDVVRDDPLRCQLLNFLNVISGRESPTVSGSDGLENLRVVEAVFESIRSEGRVRL